MLPVVGYNRYPDEKGTESIPACQLQRYPDEKGTESTIRTNRYNRYPDEKGTERSTYYMSKPQA